MACGPGLNHPPTGSMNSNSFSSFFPPFLHPNDIGQNISGSECAKTKQSLRAMRSGRAGFWAVARSCSAH